MQNDNVHQFRLILSDFDKDCNRNEVIYRIIRRCIIYTFVSKVFNQDDIEELGQDFSIKDLTSFLEKIYLNYIERN